MLVFCFILFGCSKKSEPTIVQADSTENTPMRIISMAPNLTEILFALGLDEEIVGVTKFSTYPPQAKTKTNVGTFWQPDIEAVLACRPTLVLTLGFDQQTALARRLESIGCKTLSVEIDRIDQLYDGIVTIGKDVDRESQAQAMVSRLKQQQLQLSQRYASNEPVKVLWVVQREPLRVAGTNTFVNELIEIAGGKNAIGDTVNVYPPISGEELIGSMPDVIIEPAMEMEQFEQQQASAKEFYQRFSVIPAVRNDRIYVIDGDVVSRLSPRLDEAMQRIAQCLWPEGAQCP